MNQKTLFSVVIKYIITTIFIIYLAIWLSFSAFAAYSYSEEQIKVLNDVNEIRTKMGLPSVQLDEDLTKAAVDHSIYLFANNKIQHTQENSLYKTQKEFYERIISFTGKNYHLTKGWYTIAEDVDYRSPNYAIRDLVEAPYHRYPIIHPDLTHIGVGTIGYHNTVITFGMSKSVNYLENPILSPYHNEKNVLLSQKVYENPDPFNDTPMSQEEAGYVLSIYTGTEVLSTSLNISLYDEHKNPMKFIIKSLTPQEGSDFWLVIPIKKLDPLTTYTFKVNNSISTFTTMSENDFEAWDIYREDEYLPYDINPSYFDHVISIALNPESENNHIDDNHLKTQYELPTYFQQLGYNKENVGIFLNNDYIELSPNAKIKDNRTYIPLRGLLEELGAKVNFDSNTKTITITKDFLKIELYPDNKEVVILKKNKLTSEQLDVSPFIENGVTFVPLRFLTLSLGAEIVWDQSSYTVGIAF